MRCLQIRIVFGGVSWMEIFVLGVRVPFLQEPAVVTIQRRDFGYLHEGQSRPFNDSRAYFGSALNQ